MNDLNATQKKVLQTIIDLTAEHGFPPTLDEIAAVIGLHKASVRQALNVLRDRGMVTWWKGQARTLQVING